MSDASTQFDFSEISQLAADLGDAPKTIGKNLRSAVGRTAHRVRDDWRENVSDLSHLPQLPSKISYDLIATPGPVQSEITAEIGPVNEGQGSLGGKLEYGSVNNPPRGDGHAALQRNEEDFQRGIEAAIEDSMTQVNL
jgi:hypothetical protein